MPDQNGMFARDGGANCPIDHYRTCQNVAFGKGKTYTRFPVKTTLTHANLANIKRIWLYQRINEADRMLILTTGGNLYDSLNLAVPILNIPTMTDFSAINFFNRAYISPSNGLRGLPGEKVYVYDGTSVRAAAGTKPGTALTAVVSAVAGNIRKGKRLFAIAFETASGHVTKAGPFTLYDVTVENRKVDLSNIALGPAGTAARIILASFTILDYDAATFKPENYEMFYIPETLGGRLAGNVATTITADFFDSQLVKSADYLFDNLETIPAGVTLGRYGKSMLVMGEDANATYCRVSTRGEPESFSEISGFVKVKSEDSGGDLYNASDHRGSLFFFKNLRGYVTEDNGSDPSTWKVLDLDSGQGTGPKGISQVLDSNGQTLDMFLIATQSGLIKFEGSFNTRELTWKIKDYWDRINLAAFQTIQVMVNSIKKEIFIGVPLDAATSPSHILYGDFSNGMNWDTIKWAVWLMHRVPTSIAVDTNFATKKTAFKFASNQGDVFEYDPTIRTGDPGNTPIVSFVDSPFFPDENPTDAINHYDSLKVQVRGVGNLDISLEDQYKTLTVDAPGLPLTLSPSKVSYRQVNFESEYMGVKLKTDALNEWFELFQLRVFMMPLWENLVQDA